MLYITRELYCCCTGNALQTVKLLDSVKLITVRGTGFEPAAVTGGNGETQLGG